MVKFIFILVFGILVAKFSFATNDVNYVLAELEANMSKLKTLDTKFRQIKRLSVFKKDLEILGNIFLQKPNLLSWVVLNPIKFKMVIDGNSMKQRNENSKNIQTISTKNNPAFEMAISQMKIWFSGAYKRLVDDYNISVVEKSPLKLKFVPFDNNPAKNYISEVIISFRIDKKYIKKIEIFEKNGDSMMISFYDTLINSDIDSDVWNINL